ncbi:MAG: dihydrolipoamide acetyltransferase family protein [candidate division WOR-3 bacterium]
MEKHYVIIPKLHDTMKEGIITGWLKKSGELVSVGEIIATIESEKATFELESPATGILRIFKGVGAIVNVGEVIAEIELVNENISLQKVGKALIASPSAKLLAKEYGIDLSQVTGTGPDGMITKQDVLSYIDKLKISQREKEEIIVRNDEEIIPMIGWRKVMAERMALSVRTAAQVTTFCEVDVTELVGLREKLKQLFEREYGAPLSYTALMVKAVSRALKEFPILNSYLINDKIIIKKHCNIGVAVFSEKSGLVVPVIHNAEEKSLMDIAKELNVLINKARNNELTIDHIKDGTFTITNVGMFGVLMDTPIINPPQSAILGVGAIVKRPVVMGDQIKIRSIVHLSLTYDHRVIEGMPAILFLQRVKAYLENPLILFDDVISNKKEKEFNFKVTNLHN